MHCPVCKVPMAILEFREIEVDYCFACGGCWLDAAELGLVLEGRLDLDYRAMLTHDRKGARRCPVCSRRMREANFKDTEIAVDACAIGHGLWLDRGELLSVIRAGAARDRVAALSAFCEEMFAAESQNRRSP